MKIKPYTDDSARFGQLKSVSVGGCPFKIRSVSVRGGFVYMAFFGVDTRNQAEVLVGKTLEIDRAAAKPTGENEYYIVDLLGCEVFLSDGMSLGVLDNIENYGSADIFTVVQTGKPTVRFPFLSRLELKYDAEAKTVTVDKARFEEVCCYED